MKCNDPTKNFDLIEDSAVIGLMVALLVKKHDLRKRRYLCNGSLAALRNRASLSSEVGHVTELSWKLFAGAQPSFRLRSVRQIYIHRTYWKEDNPMRVPIVIVTTLILEVGSAMAVGGTHWFHLL